MDKVTDLENPAIQLSRLRQAWVGIHDVVILSAAAKSATNADDDLDKPLSQ